jgi:hypothetical protein
MKAPGWSAQEFETLLQHPESDDQAVAELLPERSMAAVGVVRGGIHAYHREGMNRSILSEMMVRRLEHGFVTCPLCRTRL